VISNFDPPRSVCGQLNWHNRSDKADAFTEHYLAVTREQDAAVQSHREGHPCSTSQAQLSVHYVAEIRNLADE
jgi:hypothetical protein